MVTEARTLENLEAGGEQGSVSIVAQNDEPSESDGYCKRCPGCHIFFSFLSGVLAVPCFVYVSYYVDVSKNDKVLEHFFLAALFFVASTLCLYISVYFYDRELKYLRSSMVRPENSGESRQVPGRRRSFTVAYSAGPDGREGSEEAVERQISEPESEQVQADSPVLNLLKPTESASTGETKRILQTSDSGETCSTSKVSELASEISKIASAVAVLGEIKVPEASKAPTEQKEQSSEEIIRAKEKSGSETVLSSGEIRRRKLLNLQERLLTSSEEDCLK